MRTLAAVAVLLLAQPGAVMPKKVRQHPRSTAYGQGVNALIQDAQTLPTAYNLAAQAIGDADAWWTGQGSTPPPLNLNVTTPADGEHNGYGYYGTGNMEVAPGYLSNLNVVLNARGSLEGKRQALVGLWRLMAHERGHNIGYGHIPGGLMDADWAPPPGEAYAWAARVLPKPLKLRRRK